MLCLPLAVHLEFLLSMGGAVFPKSKGKELTRGEDNGELSSLLSSISSENLVGPTAGV